jgi:hypothetical protein
LTVLAVGLGFSAGSVVEIRTAMLPGKAQIARRSFDDSLDFLKNFQMVGF